MNMNLEKDQVYTVKLSSGEELVAKIVDFDSHTVQVSDPVSVSPSPQGMALLPSLFTYEPGKPVTININCIAAWAPTDESVCSKYIQATTGIQVPSKKILTG